VRFADLEVTANIQPLWACHDALMDQLTLGYLPVAARDRQYVFGSLRRAGARLACGSDWPVSSADPLLGMHVAVNRTPPGEAGVTPLLPGEALTVAEAIEGYTAGSAYLNRLERSSGVLEVGYAADVVAVDADILGVEPEAVGEVRVTHTFVDGQVVHERH
jgi:predicted amidohydrolase YtcJ